jgi:hypothetical protein
MWAHRQTDRQTDSRTKCNSAQNSVMNHKCERVESELKVFEVSDDGEHRAPRRVSVETSVETYTAVAFVY